MRKLLDFAFSYFGVQTDQMQYHDSSAVLSGISHSFGSLAKTSTEIQFLTLRFKISNHIVGVMAHSAYEMFNSPSTVK